MTLTDASIVELRAAGGTQLDNERDVEPVEVEPALPRLRTALVVGTSAVAAGVMAGGLFQGWQGRAGPIFAAIGGVVVAVYASRQKRVASTNATILLGIIGIALLLVLPTGAANVTRIGAILTEARGASKVLRPPTEFLPGWRLIVGLVFSTVGFLAAWTAIELRRPAVGLLVPLPAIAFAAISVPDQEKLGAGIATAVLFIAGLAQLSSLQSQVEGGGQGPGAGYELRRALRALPLFAVIIGVLVALGQTNILFPKPRFDPTRDAVAPKAVPLSEVEDRALFTVVSSIAGPWRIGMLDVYTDDEWRLPAFAESTLKRVPRTGVVDPDLTATVRADFTLADLGGSVLPGLPNTTGVIAEGPRLAFDQRTGNIRLAQGQVEAGLTYSVLAPALPTEDELRAATGEPPRALKVALEIPSPPPGVKALLAEAPTDNLWDRLDFVRRRLLETVVASGPGTPEPVPPSKVDDLLIGSKEGSPYEIVAAQAMLARWAGVPARIGYGFDGGNELPDGGREVRPRHGSSWLEVWFPGYKWLPVLGMPAKAKASLQPDGPTNTAPTVAPSDDIAAQVYFLTRTTPPSPIYAQARRLVLVALPFLVLSLLAYVMWPAAWKAWRRTTARRRASMAGPRRQVAQAYAEFRDRCTDLGLPGRHLSPLAFMTVLVDDDEHAELAWLVTRVVWGDLREAVTDDHVLDAVELARALQTRASQAQPIAIRLLAAISRLSMKHPYAPELARAERVDVAA